MANEAEIPRDMTRKQAKCFMFTELKSKLAIHC